MPAPLEEQTSYTLHATSPAVTRTCKPMLEALGIAFPPYNRPSGIQHDVMNGSPHPIAFIEIEIKRPEAIPFP